MAQSDSTESILKRFGAASLCTPSRRPTGTIGTPVVSPPGPPSEVSPTSVVRKDFMNLTIESPTAQPIGSGSRPTQQEGKVLWLKSLLPVPALELVIYRPLAERNVLAL